MTRSLGALIAICLALVLASPAAAGVHFVKEGLHAYEGQLAHGEVHADAFHPGNGTGHLHISLNDGRHFTVAYASGAQAKLMAQARAKGARVLLATAKAKSAKPVKHKLRYIAGGILIAVILIVLAVLLVGRRRTLAERHDDGETSEEGAAETSSEGAAS
jgi:hypothetical protein